tara:strand:- start:420 stop:875 length:456 start_codon:yes stop_codon:yes gene_type:complete
MFIYETKVHEQWIDYNEHMNVAFYYYAFETAAIELWGFIGVDELYRATEEIEIETKEGHIQFIQEANIGDSLRIESQIFDLSNEALLLGQEMFCGENILCRFGSFTEIICQKSGQLRVLEKEVYDSALSVKFSGSDLPDWLVRRVGINRSG